MTICLRKRPLLGKELNQVRLVLLVLLAVLLVQC